MCFEFGALLAPVEIIRPFDNYPYLGIELDSVKFEARPPLDKPFKAKCSLALAVVASRQKRKLLSLIGYLQHCFKVIGPARRFLRRIIGHCHYSEFIVAVSQ